MGYLSGQISIADLPTTIESVSFLGNRPKRLNIWLLAETALITIAAVSAIKIFSASWFVTPGILVSAALIPTVIRKSKLSEIGLAFGQIKYSLVVLGWTCLVVFPAMFCGLWLLKSCGLNLPLRPILPRNQEWVSWVLYQFMYVAVAEEVFFRGYVQGNILALAKEVTGKQRRVLLWLSVILSAAFFAAAHIVIHGQVISALSFLPGLVFGWLFIRTKGLLGPILFHGLANTFYLVSASVLT